MLARQYCWRVKWTRVKKKQRMLRWKRQIERPQWAL
jgi:hypothetical protein